MTSLLIALAVGAAVVFTWVTSERVARDAASAELTATSQLQDTFRGQRYEELLLLSYLFVSDPNVAAYLAESLGSGDGASVLDLMEARRADLGYDLAIVLRPDGSVLVRSDRPAEAGADLADRPLVARALEEYEAAGIWQEGGDLYEAVAVPVASGPQLVGFLVAGFVLTDSSALEMKRLSGTEVAYLALGRSGSGNRGGTAPGAPRVVAATLAPDLEDRLVSALAERGDPLGRMAEGTPAGTGEEAAPAGGRELELDLQGERWIARVSPLLDAAGQPAGAAVALTPLDAQLAPYRRIGRALLIAGALALLAALALTFAFARRTMAPVKELVAATAAARGGDYERPVALARGQAARRGDELGQLAAAFDDLLSDLREKRDMESYLTELSRTLPEPVVARPLGAARSIEPRRHEMVLALVEMRAHGSAAGGRPAGATKTGSGPAGAGPGASGGEQGPVDPGALLDRFSADLGWLARAVATRRGELLALAGDRAWLGFHGEGAAFRAFACGAELAARHAAGGSGVRTPVVALASGEVVAGAVRWGEESLRTALGPPMAVLERLVREAAPGDLVFAPEVGEVLRPVFAAAGQELVAQRAMLSGGAGGTMPGGGLFVVDATAASRLLGDESLPTLVSGPVAPDEGPERTASAAAAASPTLSSIGPGAVVGRRFEILSVLGAGGMGVVYKARDRDLEEVVAVKMLKPELAGDVGSAGRLREELRLARRITHPNVLRTFDLGEVDGIPFISMEYVRGVTLAQLLEHTGRLAYSAGRSVAKQLCQGLAAAHAQGVLHRDIKPANLILQPNGNAKLMDFGIARPLRRSEPGHTAEGWLVGTPKYLAPEVLRGDEPDARADVYACGVLLYETFTGASPFPGPSHLDLAQQTLKEPPPPPSSVWPETPPELEAILLRCLAKDPAERYRSAEALLADLSRLRA